MNRILIPIFFLLILASSCELQKESQAEVAITDGIGRKVKLPDEISSLLSLSPAMTEILFYVCPDTLIKARSQACDFPPEALNLPVISTYPFDLEGILSHNPDLILTEEGITSRDQIRMLEQNGANVYVFRYSNMAEVFSAIELVGKFCNCQEKAIAKSNKLKKDLKELNAVKGEDSKKVLGLVWTDPIYVYGKNTLFTDQLNQIGLSNAVDSVFRKPYPEISREYFLAANPDVIIGSTFERLDSTLFLNYPELRRINAYKNKSIYDIDGDILTRPGPRSVQAIRLIYQAVYEN